LSDVTRFRQPAQGGAARDEIRLNSGQTVTLLKQSRYQANGTGLYLRSADPAAA
jgi:hypothetical protein